MIFNFLKHLLLALLIDAGAGLAFGVDAAPAVEVAATPPQSCVVPAAITAMDLETKASESEKRS
jgi:hypothetical protein